MKSLESHNTSTYWAQFASELSRHLDDGDDAELWEAAINVIFTESRPVIDAYRGKDSLMTEIGRCSHWIRPHWRTMVGTAFTAGYRDDVDGYSFQSLPAFDWFVQFQVDVTSGRWQLASGQPSRRPLTHRITFPSRTVRHAQATVHTIWTPGAPDDPREKWAVDYGFERSDVGWTCFSSWDSRRNR